MGTRTVTRRQAALANARERRRRLDRDRDQHDREVEEATATVLVALAGRAEAQQLVEVATARVAGELRTLTGLDVSVERAAALVELDPAEVRRLVRAAAGPPASPAQVPYAPEGPRSGVPPGGPGEGGRAAGRPR